MFMPASTWQASCAFGSRCAARTAANGRGSWCKDMRNFVLLGFTLAIGLAMAAANAFSVACPFCNRPLPKHAFRKPGACICEFCGKEVSIV